MHERQADSLRGIGSDRFHRDLYASPEWRKLSAYLLASRPWCECSACSGSRQPRRSEVVHHREAHHGDPVWFFAESNLIALAKVCHDRLTARTRGGAR